jgi:hypothetical protein
MRKTIRKNTKEKSESNAFLHVNEVKKFQWSAAMILLEIMRQRLFRESERRAQRRKRTCSETVDEKLQNAPKKIAYAAQAA